jgi:hypothetical protein
VNCAVSVGVVAEPTLRDRTKQILILLNKIGPALLASWSQFPARHVSRFRPGFAITSGHYLRD